MSSLTGAHGLQLRETRLTATLGYLITLEPDGFLKLFGFPGKATSVRLEMQHERGRSDIVIDTDIGRGIVEAKVTTENPAIQAQKYDANWKVLLTEYVATARERTENGRRYLQWHSHVRPHLEKLGNSSKRSEVRFVAKDLLAYLEEHGMIHDRDMVEIYAREINEPITLGAFLQSHLYFCKYEKGGSLSRMKYFAPHFGQSLAAQHPGISVGISYVAKIKEVQVVDEWDDVEAALKRNYKHKWKGHAARLAELKKTWKWDQGDRRNLLFLDRPRHVFSPAIVKESLQKGKGWLSKRFFSFDELFEAWGV